MRVTHFFKMAFEVENGVRYTFDDFVDIFDTNTVFHKTFEAILTTSCGVDCFTNKKAIVQLYLDDDYYNRPIVIYCPDFWQLFECDKVEGKWRVYANGFSLIPRYFRRGDTMNQCFITPINFPSKSEIVKLLNEFVGCNNFIMENSPIPAIIFDYIQLKHVSKN